MSGGRLSSLESMEKINRGLIPSVPSSTSKLVIAAVVYFKDYVGPSFHGLNSHGPICPITVSCNISNTHCERTHLHLHLAWSMKIHKSQGLTLKQIWVDIGKSECDSGLFYIALKAGFHML